MYLCQAHLICVSLLYSAYCINKKSVFILSSQPSFPCLLLKPKTRVVADGALRLPSDL